MRRSVDDACDLETKGYSRHNAYRLDRRYRQNRAGPSGAENRMRARHARAGNKNRRTGVRGINPHAGEHCLSRYREEESKIEPAIQVVGPASGTSKARCPPIRFLRAGRGDFDIVVAMYHDQDHGPVKALGIESGVKIMIGLQVIGLERQNRVELLR